MAGELWGPAAGHHLAEQDLAKQSMVIADVQHKAALDYLVPFQAKAKDAQTKYLTSRTETVDRALMLDKQLATLAAGHEWTPDQLPNPPRVLAMYAGAIGDTAKQVKYSNIAAGIDSKAATAVRALEQANLAKVRVQVGHLALLGQQAGVATSPEQLAQALKEGAVRSKTLSPYLDQDGNLTSDAHADWRGVQSRVVQESQTTQQRTIADYRKKVLASADALRKARIGEIKAAGDLDTIEKREAAKVRGRGAKVGAGVLNKAEGVRLGTERVTQSFAEIDPKSSHARVMGRMVAERAATIKANNPALTPLETSQQAFEAMVREGIFGGMERTDLSGGGSRSKPLPLPPKGPNGEVDSSKLKSGVWYTDGKGDVRLWRGDKKGFISQKDSGIIKPASASPYQASPTSQAVDEVDEGAAQEAADAAQEAEDDALALGD